VGIVNTSQFSSTVSGVSFSNPLPAALSPSRLADFQSCPRRFQYASVERIAQPATYATAKGNVVHHIFEQLFLQEPTQRTKDFARSAISSAESHVLTDQVREEIALDDAGREKLRREITAIIDRYFEMEDPSQVHHEGVELRIHTTIDGVPMLGILDRLDRDADGQLTIVDYKTGSLPNRHYDTQTFANADLYAALCENQLGERPRSIRLLYVAHGEAIERSVSGPVLKARRDAAAGAWKRITSYYDAGEFPATPSKNACRFCSFKQICRDSGVAVVS
jgi:putative RecB family exonuclease